MSGHGIDQGKAAELGCPGCAAPVFAGESFCESCGRPIDAAAALRGACAECGSLSFSEDGYCERCGMRRPGDRDHVEIETPVASGVTDKGRRHSHNEDAMALSPLDGGGVAAVVCDGVSTSARPQDASQAAADTGVAVLSGRLAAGDHPEAATRAAALRAAEAVTALADQDSDAPACTYVSALVRGDRITVGWIGDSRAYWLAATGARQLTGDDSWAAQMVQHGVMSEAEAQAHPNAHVLTGWLGADAGPPDPHVSTFVPEGPGAVLICSDGLWNYVPEAAALAAAVPAAAAEPLAAAQRLTRIALEAGGRDNITVVLIPVPPVQPTSEKAE